MIVGNGLSIGRLPLRYRGGNAIASADFRPNSGMGGPARNFFFMDAPGAPSKYGSIPSGYVPPYCWTMAQSTGGMATYTTLMGDGEASSANLAGGLGAEATVSGTGDILDADIRLLILASASLIGLSSISSALLIGGQSAFATLAADSALSASASAVLDVASTMSGSGQVSYGLMTSALEAFSTISGTSDLTALVAGVVEIASLLSSNGSVQASVRAVSNLSSGLDGSGTLLSSIQSLADLVASITSSGSVSASGYAKAFMSADVTPFTTLSPENLAASVWNTIASEFNQPGSMGQRLNGAASSGDPWGTPIPGSYPPGTAGAVLSSIASDVLGTAVESGLSVNDALKLMVAVLAGKASGGDTATIRFRNTADTLDRVVMSVDTNGNRTSVTKNLL